MPEVRRHHLIHVLIGRSLDEVGDTMFLAIIANFWFGKGSFAPLAKALEQGAVALHHGFDELQSAIDGMAAARPPTDGLCQWPV